MLSSNDALNALITNGAFGSVEREQEILDYEGQSFQVRVIVTEGGSRYVRLRRQDSDAG